MCAQGKEEPVCACFIEEVVLEQLLIGVKMTSPWISAKVSKTWSDPFAEKGLGHLF